MTPHRFDTALLVAAQPRLRLALRQPLLASGVHKVLEAGTAAEALTQLSSELVSVVLTVWELPDLAGRALLQAFRNRGRNRDVPVVLLDENLPRESVVLAVKAGAAGRLSLPAQREALLRVLGQIATDARLPQGTARQGGSPRR